MSTLEKTINLLNELPERQLEILYSYAQFISSQQSEHKSMDDNELNDVLDSIVGVLPDTGKSLEDYREERMTERYEYANWYKCDFKYGL